MADGIISYLARYDSRSKCSCWIHSRSFDRNLYVHVHTTPL